MEREILFRGKRLDNGEWVEGMLCQFHEGISAKIAPNDFGTFESSIAWVVDPSTVGQYTGLTDKKGKRIFEGDIVSAKNNICKEVYVFLVKFGICGGAQNVDHAVGYPCFFFEETKDNSMYHFMTRKDPVFFLNEYACEIIGNIHDNPELLKGVKNE